jgi:hypothetical protein
MALEWAGTSMGNWRWAPLVPFLGLRSANPPAGVGILYIILDVVVVLATFRLQHRPVPPDVRAIATVTP